jgi:hypothetical protein
MLLTAGLIIALVSTYTEIKLVHGSQTIRSLYTKGMGKVEGIWFNTAGSFFLSYLLGAMFSADGMTVLLGAVLSTGLSQMYFSGEEFLSGREFNLSAKVQGIKDGYNTTAAIARDFKQPLLDFAKILLWTLRAITFPFAIARKLSVAYTERKAP